MAYNTSYVVCKGYMLRTIRIIVCENVVAYINPLSFLESV